MHPRDPESHLTGLDLHGITWKKAPHTSIYSRKLSYALDFILHTLRVVEVAVLLVIIFISTIWGRETFQAGADSLTLIGQVRFD